MIIKFNTTNHIIAEIPQPPLQDWEGLLFITSSLRFEFSPVYTLVKISFSRRVYRQQVDLDPHFFYYHSWQLGKVVLSCCKNYMSWLVLDLYLKE